MKRPDQVIHEQSEEIIEVLVRKREQRCWCVNPEYCESIGARFREVVMPPSTADLIEIAKQIPGVEVRNRVFCDSCGARTIKSENHPHGKLVTRWFLEIPIPNP